MSQDEAGKLASYAILGCAICAAVTTALVLLGIEYWSAIPACLAVVALFLSLDGERINQRSTRHGWNHHKAWLQFGKNGALAGLVGLVVAGAFALFAGDPVSLVETLVTNGALLVAGFLAIIIPRESQLDL